MSIKVVISGIHYPLSMMTYFIRAFQRRADVELITAGPYTGDWIPWAGGINIPKKYVHAPNIPLPMGFIGQSGMASSTIQAQLPWEPNLWLQVDAGWWLRKPKASCVAHVATDPHVLDYTQQRKECDIFFNMQLPYSQPGDKYLPYAFDPTLHYPMPEVRKEHDGCLIGLHYEHRDALVGNLIGLGYDMYYGLGEIFDEYRLRYNQSKVAISWSSLDDMPARVWEAFGMGLPLLTNRVSDLSNYFVEGDHYIGFSNVGEGISKFEFMMNEPEMCQEIAGNAYRKVKDAHTWDKRVEQILETAKLI